MNRASLERLRARMEWERDAFRPISGEGERWEAMSPATLAAALRWKMAAEMGNLLDALLAPEEGTKGAAHVGGQWICAVCEEPITSPASYAQHGCRPAYWLKREPLENWSA